MGIPIRVDFIPLISHGFLETAPGITSNVGTSMGLYYMIGGYPFTLFMTTLMSVLSYLFYFKAIRVKSPIWIFLNFIFLTMMMMSFYGQYFTTITPFEMTIIFMLFIYIFNFLNWGKEKKTT
jgi:hypothetical protein